MAQQTAIAQGGTPLGPTGNLVAPVDAVLNVQRSSARRPAPQRPPRIQLRTAPPLRDLFATGPFG